MDTKHSQTGPETTQCCSNDCNNVHDERSLVWSLSFGTGRRVRLSTKPRGKNIWIDMSIYNTKQYERGVSLDLEEFAAIPMKPILKYITRGERFSNILPKEYPIHHKDSRYLNVIAEYELIPRRVVRVGVEKHGRMHMVMIYIFQQVGFEWELKSRVELCQREFFYLRQIFDEICSAAFREERYLPSDDEYDDVTFIYDEESDENDIESDEEKEKKAKKKMWCLWKLTYDQK